MIVFAGNRGRVVRLNDPAAQASIGFVSVKDAPIRFTEQRSIITRLMLDQHANVQFLHTLGAHVYVYVFGDRIGTMGLSGLSFNSPCGGLAPDLGVEQMLTWYRTNRVSSLGKPVRVLIGSTPFEGFVVASTEDVVDPETGLVQWGVQLQTLPEA